MTEEPNPPRAQPVEHNGTVVGRTVRINLAQVEAVLHRPDRPWDQSLGIHRRRNQAARAVREKASPA